MFGLAYHQKANLDDVCLNFRGKDFPSKKLTVNFSSNIIRYQISSVSKRNSILCLSFERLSATWPISSSFSFPRAENVSEWKECKYLPVWIQTVFNKLVRRIVRDYPYQLNDDWFMSLKFFYHGNLCWHQTTWAQRMTCKI